MLATVTDFFSLRVFGTAMQRRQTDNVPVQGLVAAVCHREPNDRVWEHSYQRTQLNLVVGFVAEDIKIGSPP